METFMDVIETVIVIVSVIGLLWSGIWIGREFGSFEAFVIALIDLATEREDA